MKNVSRFTAYAVSCRDVCRKVITLGIRNPNNQTLIIKHRVPYLYIYSNH
jgi:hypothetical protein